METQHLQMILTGRGKQMEEYNGIFKKSNFDCQESTANDLPLFIYCALCCEVYLWVTVGMDFIVIGQSNQINF